MSFTGGAAGLFLPFEQKRLGEWWNLRGGQVFFYYLALMLAAGAVVATALLARSRLGYQWLAVREDETAASNPSACWRTSSPRGRRCARSAARAASRRTTPSSRGRPRKVGAHLDGGEVDPRERGHREPRERKRAGQQHGGGEQ